MPRPLRAFKHEAAAAEAVLVRWLRRVQQHGSDLLHIPLTDEQKAAIRLRLGDSEDAVDTMDELSGTLPQQEGRKYGEDHPGV